MTARIEAARRKSTSRLRESGVCAARFEARVQSCMRCRGLENLLGLDRGALVVAFALAELGQQCLELGWIEALDAADADFLVERAVDQDRVAAVWTDAAVAV